MPGGESLSGSGSATLNTFSLTSFMSCSIEKQVLTNLSSQGGYYHFLERHMPKQVLHQLMQLALRYLQLAGLVDVEAAVKSLQLAKVRIVPRLHHSQACCIVPFERHYSSVQVGSTYVKHL